MSETTIGGRTQAVCGVTYVGAAVNVMLVILKLLAGLLGHSAALVADAVHSLSDFITDIAVVVFIKLASKPSDACHDFGHGKFETLATVLIGIVLAIVAVGLFSSGLAKTLVALDGTPPARPSAIALIAAAIAIGAKEWLYRYTRHVGERCNSQAVIANAWEHRSDALSSIGAFAGIGGAIVLGERGAILDPIAAIVVSLLIIHAAWRLIKPSVAELLEQSLPQEIEAEILSLVTADPAVTDPHNLRTRRLGPAIVAQVHVRIAGDMSVTEAHEHTQGIEERIHRHFGELAHIIVHVEPRK